jgi:AcrR family transcriptional regulator
MSIAERDAENETREKLIAAGETLFAQQGYQRVSVRAIAAAAGVNWSLLGYYFRGKEGLLSEVYRRHCDALLRLPGSFCGAGATWSGLLCPAPHHSRR